MTARNGYHMGLRALLPHKQRAKNQRDTVKENLPHRLVAYSPELARIVGGVTTGAYLSQLMFLSDKGNNEEGWIYKSETEMAQETGLTKREQQTARRKLLALGVIEIKRGGWRNTYHFRIAWEKLLAVIADYQREQTDGTGTEYPQTVATTQSLQQQSVSTQRTQTVPTEREQTGATEWQQNGAPQDREYNRENNQERTGRENELTQNDTKEITWNLTLTKLKEQVPASTFATWIKDTVLVHLEKHRAVVLVANRMVREWLERRLYWGIVRALRDVLQYDVDLQFVTSP
jgi:hypothetical protein